MYQYCQANPVGYVDPSGHNCGTTQSRYNSDEEQHPKANAAGGYTSATEKGNSKSGSASDELIHVYRGTNKYAEIAAYNETGQLMSDATRNLYFETGNLVQEDLNDNR